MPFKETIKCPYCHMEILNTESRHVFTHKRIELLYHYRCLLDSFRENQKSYLHRNKQ